MKTTTIDTNLLPHVYLMWTTTKGTFYLDCVTGEKTTEHLSFESKYKATTRCVNSNSKPRFAYAKYHEDLEMLEVAEVTIDTTRKEEPKAWRYAGEKYFIKKDKTVVDANGNEKLNSFILSPMHRSYDFKGFLGMFYRIETPFVVQEFKKFLGADTYTVGSGRLVTVTYAWHIQEWYKTKQKVKGIGKQQKLTNKLTEMPVTDIATLNAKYPYDGKDRGSYRWSTVGIIYFERLADGWSVLRVFHRNYNDGLLAEKERMYLHDNGSNRIVTPSKDGWVPARQNNSYGHYKFINQDEASEKCNRLKYILPLVRYESDTALKRSLITILRFPEIEQMMSLGYHTAAKSIAHSNTPNADLKFMFGGYYNNKEKSILRKSGLNKHQLDHYMEVYHNNRYYGNRCAGSLQEMRKVFGDGLVHLDNESFDDYFDGFVEMHRGYGRQIFHRLESLNIDRAKFIKNAFRLGKKNKNVYTMLDDTMNQYAALNMGTQPEINWYFDSYSDVVRAHDAIDGLKRAQDAERRAIYNKAEAERLKREEKKRIELDKKRKEYEYEDDVYVIRLPEGYNEIIREGSMQRICIGGYTSRHALGQTNLFFLRRKSDPTVPFYAIEMDNTKSIVQIHGYCNSWLGNNPEAIPTVVRWLRKNGIKCNEKILTCKAKGYGMINDYVPMPVVD